MSAVGLAPASQSDPLRKLTHREQTVLVLCMSPLVRTFIAATTALIGMVYTSQASACYIPPIPLPPEAVRQMDLDYQTGLWSRSSIIYVATISRRARSRHAAPGTDVRLDEITIELARTIKGTTPRSRLVLKTTGITSCGPSPSWDAMGGAEGDQFVVFSASPKPTQATILDAIEVNRIIQPDLLDAMSASHP